MKISEAVTVRINEILRQNNMSLYKLEKKSVISHDTIKSIRKGKTNGVNLRTIILICNGFNIKLKDFFDTNLFDYEKIDIN